MPISNRNETPNTSAVAAVRLHNMGGLHPSVQLDLLAIEEPLEIRLGCDVDGQHVNR